MVGSKTGKGPRGDFKSQVPHVMLHLNPGVSRQLDKQLSTLERLRVKAQRTAENRRQLYVDKFEERRRNRERLYRRLTKMDDDTRRTVDRITNQRRLAEMEEENRERDERLYSARSAEQESSRHEGMPDSPTTAMNSERPWPDTEADYSSRRSSLRSVSIYEMDGEYTSRGSPEPTDDPLGRLDQDDKGVQGSRRSSGASNMPEVFVTKAPKLKRDTSSEGTASESKEEDGGPALQKLMNLLPAPTPTRFLGKMYSVVSSPEKRRASNASDVPDTIKESLNETDGKDEIIKTDESKQPVRKKGMGDIAMKARVMGRFKGLSKQASVSSDAGSDQPPTGQQSPATAATKKSSWRRMAQKSVDRPSGSRPVSRPMSPEGDSPGPHKKNSGGGGGGWRKISGAGGGVKGGASPRGGGAKKGRGFASRVAKLSRDSSFGPTGNLSSNLKSLTTASYVIGKVMKKSAKKTDDEILAAFGHESDDSDEVNVFMEAHNKTGSKDKGNGNGATESGRASKTESLLSRVTASKSGGGFGKSIFAKLQKQGSLTKDDDGDGKVSLDMVSKLAQFQRQTRFLIAAAYVGSHLAPLDELKKTWLTGIPTSIRFLGRSCRFVPRGPGGLVVSATPPPIGSADPDFSTTANMLTILSKADIKLKTLKISHEDESRVQSRLSVTGLMKQQKSRQGSRRASMSSQNSSNIVRAEEPKVNSQLESEDQTKKLMDALKNVRPASIPRWNEHKDVKEDKEREPCFFIPWNLNSDLDAGSLSDSPPGGLEKQPSLFSENK